MYNLFTKEREKRIMTFGILFFVIGCWLFDFRYYIVSSYPFMI